MSEPGTVAVRTGSGARAEPSTTDGRPAFGARERRAEIARLVAELERVSVADLTGRFLVTDASDYRALVGPPTVAASASCLPTSSSLAARA
jgi:hypothetical protein